MLAVSAAMQVTVVTPTGKLAPEAGAPDVGAPREGGVVEAGSDAGLDGSRDAADGGG